MVSIAQSHVAGETQLPEIDINWLEEERLNMKVIQHDDLPTAWSTVQVRPTGMLDLAGLLCFAQCCSCLRMLAMQ